MLGGMAIGNMNGEIRLYKSPEAVRASTLMPGFGDPILGLDVSLDGKWVLATCPQNLIVIPAGTGAGGKTGFERSLGKERRNPIRLSLQLADVQRLGLGRAKFTYATFNNGSDMGTEEAIITGIGSYIVLWNFDKVKKGKLFNYSIKKADNEIIVNQFKFDRPEDVVVTMPQTLRIAKLVRPHRAASKKK